jgi:hypothetical protein
MLPPLFLKDIPAHAINHDKPHIEDDVESTGSDLGVKRELRELNLANEERQRVIDLNKDLPNGPLPSPNQSQASGEWRREFFTRDDSKYEKGIVYVTKPARANERGRGYLEDETLVAVVNPNDSEFTKHNRKQAQRIGRIFCCLCVTIFGLFICGAVSIILVPLALRG